MRVWWMAILACTMATAAKADVPRVVASILPVHSIASSVMEGVGKPTLLVPPGASPHAYAMRPSEAEALSKAHLVVWVGPAISSFLTKPIETLAPDASVLTLMDADGIHLLPIREGGSFEAHDHAHGHEDHDDQGHKDDHDDHDDHDHKGHDHDSHGHKDDHDDHDHKSHDHDDHGHKDDHDDHARDGERPDHPEPHIWLETHNAEVMARAIAERLAELDPDNASAYRQNAAAFAARMETLESQLESLLKPAAGKPFIVFHDAWQHLERQFGLTAVGSITINPEQRPGARHVSRLRSRIADLGAVCIFSEPQFDDRLVETLVEGTDARKADADPLGDLSATPGIGYYEVSMTRAAEAFRSCLVN